MYRLARSVCQLPSPYRRVSVCCCQQSFRSLAGRGHKSFNLQFCLPTLIVSYTHTLPGAREAIAREGTRWSCVWEVAVASKCEHVPSMCSRICSCCCCCCCRGSSFNEFGPVQCGCDLAEKSHLRRNLNTRFIPALQVGRVCFWDAGRCTLLG